MRKTIAPFIVLLLLTAAGHAQHVGIKGGFNISNYYDYNHRVIEVSSRNNFHYGLVAFWAPNRTLAFQAEVLYNEKGGQYDLEIIDENGESRGTGTRRDSYAYLEVPLLLKIPIDVFKIRPEFVVGPSVSYLLNRKSTVTGKDYYSEATSTDGYSKYIVNLVLGGDMFVPLFKGGLLVDVRFMTALNSFYDFSGSTIKHKQLMFSVGYVFGM